MPLPTSLSGSFSGLEKFSHLEDKIRLAVELCRALKQDKESLQRDLAQARRHLDDAATEREGIKAEAEVARQKLQAEIDDLNDFVGRLKAERDATRIKVEEMMTAIAALELEAESTR